MEQTGVWACAAARPAAAVKQRRFPFPHPHSHGAGMLSIDQYAQRSRLRGVSPFVKAGFALAVLLLCVGADLAAVGLAVSAGMLLAAVFFSGAPVRYVLSLMAVPVLFIVASCLAVLFDVPAEPLGFFDVPLFGFCLSATEAGLRQAGRLFCRAYGAVACLYFLSLTTPMQELLEVLRRLRLPRIVIELMYLIYRYIFLLLDAQNRMTVAARSRLGYAGRRGAWYTFTHISGSVLAGAFRRSGACFDAMEARCYDGTLRFLTRQAPVRRRHVLLCCAAFLPLAALTALLKWKGVDLF